MVRHDWLRPFREANNDTSTEQYQLDVSGDAYSSAGETELGITHDGSNMYELGEDSTESDDSDVNVIFTQSKPQVFNLYILQL